MQRAQAQGERLARRCPRGPTRPGRRSASRRWPSGSPTSTAPSRPFDPTSGRQPPTTTDRLAAVRGLAPVGRAAVRGVGGGAALADDALEALLLGRREQLWAVVVDLGHLPVPAGEVEPVEQRPSRRPGLGGEVGSEEAQQVEDHQGHRAGGGQALGATPVGDVHPLGEGVEARPAAVEGDDLAVEQHVVVVAAELLELGVGRRHVALVARPDGDDAVAHVDEHPHPVPLDLVHPRVTGRHAIGDGGQHGAHAAHPAGRWVLRGVRPWVTGALRWSPSLRRRGFAAVCGHPRKRPGCPGRPMAVGSGSGGLVGQCRAWPALVRSSSSGLDDVGPP